MPMKVISNTALNGNQLYEPNDAAIIGQNSPTAKLLVQFMSVAIPMAPERS
jgi:hypothetical protein